MCVDINRLIEDLGQMRKRITGKSDDDYPIEAAAKSFKNFINSPESKAISNPDMEEDT